ncbi:MAG TPA: hypothetical protein PJ982_08165 [Lacipirellulaceae bacterium]|nr:hypothetical protein [Lacipirellulaceae bacterium]
MFRVHKNVIAAALKNYPAIFWPIAALREGTKKRLVRRTSDIVIEGFWRCGNHFAVYAFQVAQGGRADIAHHFHAQAQLMLAARWGVPAILLIREPTEAVASATVFLEHDDPRPLLRFYNLFHSRLVGYVDRLVVSDFPVTVNDFGGVIAAVNARFGRSFAAFHGTPEELAEVDRLIRAEHAQNMGAAAATLPLPSAAKAKLKERVLTRLADPSCAPLLDEARRLYADLKAHSVPARPMAEAR